jgi:hypothetical protein
MHRHTRQLSLVRDKRLELREAPGVECSALRPPSPHPRANIGQIFDRNRSLCAFGLRYNPLGDHMVDVFGKAGFLPSQDAQPAAASQGAESLQLISEPAVPVAHVLDRAPAVDFSVVMQL